MVPATSRDGLSCKALQAAAAEPTDSSLKRTKPSPVLLSTSTHPTVPYTPNPSLRRRTVWGTFSGSYLKRSMRPGISVLAFFSSTSASTLLSPSPSPLAPSPSPSAPPDPIAAPTAFSAFCLFFSASLEPLAFSFSAHSFSFCFDQSSFIRTVNSRSRNMLFSSTAFRASSSLANSTKTEPLKFLVFRSRLKRTDRTFPNFAKCCITSSMVTSFGNVLAYMERGRAVS
mmetsp:Transcript_23837/g.39211  ORF Transcript_23837/g.39211 Transcript_23837/m.39211 type:complete len:228 (-) Transcript_23837:445-1128(-)